MKKVLITGGAGFIGYHLSLRLLQENFFVVSIDNLNDYYSVDLKRARIKDVESLDYAQQYEFHELDIVDAKALNDLFALHSFDYVINLAAQAGVRYSLENPQAYIDSNLVGFANLLEACRKYPPEHFLYASSSSVYGMNQKQPFSVDDVVDHPVSLYAATKKSNELMAFSYSHLYKIPTTGLRFFTVYGPWGRPDMAYFKFTKAILAGETIDVYNHGEMHRDFTYIDDIVSGIVNLLRCIPVNKARKDSAAEAPYALHNIGNNQPVELKHFIQVLEGACGQRAKKNFLPMQAGDVPITYADIDSLQQATDFSPSTSIESGLGRFVDWYKAYYAQ